MRKLAQIALFNLALLALLLGLLWLTQRTSPLPDSQPVTTPVTADRVGASSVAAPAEAAASSVPVSEEAPSAEGKGSNQDGEQPVSNRPMIPPDISLVEAVPSDLILDPGDPFYNDAPTQTITAQSFFTEAVNPRHARLTFEFEFGNEGPGEVTILDVYVAIPQSRDNQRVSDLTFSAPYALLTDRYGQEMAHFEFTGLAPGQQVKVSWEADVEVEAKDYGIDPEKVSELNQIPSDVLEAYTSNEEKYRLDSPAIQRAAQVAAQGATNPYWIARNVHDYVARRLSYDNDGLWDDAETVYFQRSGSCSEYTFLFISLARANGLPARYVAGTRQRKEGTYVDTLFHRWHEVYLPPYGWVPVDALHDDKAGGPHYDYFGAISDERFATTVNGGDSEYLGWNYHYGYRYDYEGSRPEVVRSRRFIWEPYPPQLRVSPNFLSAYVLPDTPEALVGKLGIVTTNGASEWSIGAASSWLRLEKDGGRTPDVVRLWADTTGLALGRHSGVVTLESQPIGGSITIPIEVQVVEEIPQLGLSREKANTCSVEGH